jgi:ADP-ribosylglycohydrolase/predicted protein tyrosine phosphatase
MRLTTAQRERAIGVIIGQACGDALGVPYEFGSPPADGRPVMKGGGLGPFAPGEWSDDTQMALCIAEVAATGVDLTTRQGLDAVASRFEQWKQGGPADVGIHTGKVLSRALLLDGSPSERLREASNAVHERTGKSAGNGALMRTAPVALAYLDDPAGAAQAARTIAELTHFDPRAGDSCVLWTDLIRQAVLTGEWHVDLELIPEERREYWAGLVDAALSGEPADFASNGNTMQAFQAALASVMVAQAAGDEAVRAGLTAAVMAGHDTDTVAAIAGGLIGGTHGLGAIPAEWVARIEGWPGYRAHDLVGLALAIVAEGAVQGSWPWIGRMEHPAARPLAAPHPDDPELLIGTLVDLDRAQDLGVEAVISLCRIGTEQVAPGAVPPERHAQVWLIDSEDPDDNPNLYAVLADAAMLARTWRMDGRRVLVHCVAAERRALSVALAYAGAVGADLDDTARRLRDLHPRANAHGLLWDAAEEVARQLKADRLSDLDGIV